MKHAILIMAHSQPTLIEKTILLLDNKSIDFYIHLDKKANYDSFDYLSKISNYSTVYFIPRKRINWGGDSIIKAEINLFIQASKNYDYGYFHLISGQDLPTLNGDSFVSKFKESTKNYIISRRANSLHLERVKYYHPIMQIGLVSRKKLWWKVDKMITILQSFFKIDRSKGKEIYFGSQWCSLTREFVIYLTNYSETKEFQSIFFNASIPDEVYKQTVFMEWLSTKDDINTYWENCNLRFTKWVNGESSPEVLTWDNYNELKSSEYIFARKFSENNDFPEIFISMINNNQELVGEF